MVQWRGWCDAQRGRRRMWLAFGSLLACCAGAVTAVHARQLPSSPLTVRPPAVAGSFYPADAPRLRAAVTAYLERAVPTRGWRSRVLVAPHAAFVFSGQIAADAFRQTDGQSFDTIVVLAPNHTRPSFRGIAVWDGDAWDTPLGRVRVDRELVRALLESRVGAVVDPTVHEKEHAIEVLVPFVQTLHPRASIVPVVVGTTDPAVCARLGRALAKLAEERAVLIVASTDLAHYPSAANARRLDHELLRGWIGPDGGGFAAAAERSVGASEIIPVPGLVTRACGLGPMLAAREAARALGAGRASVLSYANSADAIVAGPDRAVGYAAVLFADGQAETDLNVLERPKPDESGALDDDDKRVLLRLARDTIAGRLASETLPLPRGGSPRLLRDTGVFVTLKARGQLRGCIGRILPEGPLIRLVSAMAFESAFNDSRFAPVTLRELSGLEIEISVLTRPRDISRVEDIQPGRDGVLLRVGDKGAVFLPQVAAEEGWTRTDLLDNLALKAGLPASAWRDRKARFQTFQANVFSEREARVSGR